MQRAIRKAERMTGDGSQVSGTGLTILKREAAKHQRLDSPLQRLAANKTIGPEEIRAADDFMRGYEALTSEVRMRAIELERIDRGRSDHVPASIIDAVSRYKAFTNYWSRRAKKGDPTLAIVFAAVVDEWPIRIIGQDRGMANGRVSAAIVSGLRDYAMRAGWVDSKLAAMWGREAVPEFQLRRVG